jgi:hypothetical protein
MMSTRWLNFEKGRQETSTKLNILRMRRLRTDEENTSTSYSTMRVRKPRSSWTTQLTPIGDLFGEFKSLR